MNDYSTLTPNERLNRICEILLRGIYRNMVNSEEGSKISVAPPTDPTTYTVSAAARKLGISRRSLHRYMSTGLLSVDRKPNGQPMLHQSHLQALRIQLQDRNNVKLRQL